MTDFNYKDYSLNKLEEWIHDAILVEDATAQEIYNVITKVVKECQDQFSKQKNRCDDLLSLLNGTQTYYINDHDTSYNLWKSYDVKKDSSKKWILPVEVDGPSGEYFIMFPDDLLEAADLKEGDEVYWDEKGDGTFILRKVTKPLGMDEC